MYQIDNYSLGKLSTQFTKTKVASIKMCYGIIKELRFHILMILVSNCTKNIYFRYK